MNFMNLCMGVFELVCVENKEFIVMGDLNCDFLVKLKFCLNEIKKLKEIFRIFVFM